MKRVIVDYAKLTNEILTLLVEKFPDGYDDSDIILLVKVSTKLSDRIENYDEDDSIEEEVVVDKIAGLKEVDIEDDEEEEEDEEMSNDSDDPEDLDDED